MIFSSLEFIAFFSIFVLTLLVFRTHQRVIIILFSFIFYASWKPIFSLIIIYLILISYFSIKKNLLLKITIPLLLTPLIYFKYLFFLTQILEVEDATFLSYSNNLPLGVSFITFTAIALVVDIKKKIFQESITLSKLSEFIFYFPQLIAGPILRGKMITFL